MILAVGCLAGFALAWAAGADPRSLGGVRLRWSGLVLVALALQILIFAAGVNLPANISSLDAHVASYALLLAFAARNARIPGFALAALGLASNAVAIFANSGRMPVSPGAWADSTRIGTSAPLDGVYNNVATMHAGTHLAFLGDVFALPSVLPLANTFSVGDVLLVAGATLFVYRNGRRAGDRPSSRALEPLRVQEFRALLAGRTISKLGDWISIAALVTWIYAHSHSTLGVSAILLARLTASIAGSVVGGVILDRFGRFETLGRVEVARALTTAAAIGLVATDHSFAVAGCVFVSSFLAAATDPTASSLVADILPSQSLHAGNALHAVARAAVMAIGSIAGGLVTARLGAVPALTADCATFVVAAAFYSVSARRARAPRQPVGGDDRTATGPSGSRLEALRFICDSRRVCALVGSFAIATFAMGLLNASLPAFLSTHAPNGGGYGVAMGLIGAGLMCGEFLSGRLTGRVVSRTPALGFAVSAAAVAVGAASNVPATILLMLFLLGVSDGTTETAYDTVVQTDTPRALSARVFALAGAVQQTGMVAGFVTAPILQRTVPGAALMTTSCALGASALIATLVIADRRARRAPRRPTESPLRV